MNKSEFLKLLRQALDGEVASSTVEQNISYYDGYISAQTAEDEEKTIEILGDPRLIAKTIIEADKAAKERIKGNWPGGDSQRTSSDTQENQEERASYSGQNIFLSKMQWYHKLIVAVVMVILFVIIAMIGRLIIGFLFAFGLPILLLLLVMSLLRRR